MTNKPTNTAKRGRLKWNIPFASLKGSGAGTLPGQEVRSLVAEDSEDDGSDSDATSNDEVSSEMPQRSRDSLVPEADESVPIVTSADDSRSVDIASKKRFSVGWGRFMPKPGTISRPEINTGSTTSVMAESSYTPTKEVLVAAEISRKQSSEAASSPNEQKTSIGPAQTLPVTVAPPQRRELETKILRQIIREFGCGGFFYSFDLDLTHSLQHKRQSVSFRTRTDSRTEVDLPKNETTSSIPPPAPKSPQESRQPRKKHLADNVHSRNPSMDDFVEPDIRVPLWRRVDRRFFWNEWLLKDFLDLGLHAYIIPMMQGWVQSSTFIVPVPPNPFDPTISLDVVPIDMVIISRRSRDRAGLRYQRRGIDDEGHVANMVETEMMVRAKVSGSTDMQRLLTPLASIRWRARSPCSVLFKSEAPSH